MGSDSEFDVDIDEEDLHQIELAEKEAISKLQPSPSLGLSSQPSFAIPSSISPQSANVNKSSIPRTPRTPRTKNASQNITWFQSQSSFDSSQPLKGRSRPNESRSHHYLDEEAAQTWIYPISSQAAFRGYQFNIVQRALFDNILVSLPTGLGKTFIAATVMFNYHRWFPKSKIIFLAPTKPLVQQQVEACFNVCGVPYSQTAQLTGAIMKAQRQIAYEERQVFYMTPQTLSNDLKSGICNAKSIVCLVIDEAHRGTGNYAYSECVTFIRKTNPSLRILALSATPGATVEAVQNVIDALCIARVEIRIEESMDLKPYLHKRQTDTIVVPLGPEITALRDLFAKVIRKFLDRVKGLNDYRLNDPLTISLFGVKSARDAFMQSPSARSANNPSYKFMISAVLGVLSSLAHALSLLLFHGIRPFYEKLEAMQEEYRQQGPSLSKTKAELLSNHDFQDLMLQLKVLVDNPNTVGHPKLDRAASMIIDHFVKMQDQNQDTRVIVFAQYRASATELVRQLRRQEPIIKPTIFVGQSTDTRGASGMKQKEQIEVIQRFKDGEFNVLVATSIGEEGLDIGDVDLIICYDTSSSPIRMLQRMGRTGRKREGHVVFLLTEGKEERDHVKSQDNYLSVQRKIAAGTDFHFHPEKSPRILPNQFQPLCIKKELIPPNETPDELELKPGRRKRLPKPHRDWNLPENVETGFIKASTLGKRKRSENIEDIRGFVNPNTLVSPFMSKEDEEKVRRQRVSVSPTPKRMDFLNTETSGNIPASSVRKRLVRTQQAMKDPVRLSPIYTADDIEELTRTPDNLLANQSPRKRLTKRGENIDPFNLKLKRSPKLFERWNERLSSPDDNLPDIFVKSSENRPKGITKRESDKRKRNSDDEYGEFELTPRKKIKLPTFSDEE